MSVAAEFMVAANLATVRPSHRHRDRDGDSRSVNLIAERVKPWSPGLLQAFKHNAQRPQYGHVYQRHGHGVRAPVVFYNPRERGAALLKPGDLDGLPSLPAACDGLTAVGIFRPPCRTTGR